LGKKNHKENENIYSSLPKNQAPCMNCLLIEMGEMACYQERCPQCGRIPPDRRDQSEKKAKHPAVLKKLIGRQFPSKNANFESFELELINAHFK
jgi:hypothetical protein